MENKLYSLTSPITARPKSGNLFSIFSRVKSSTISTCSKTQSSVDDREAVIEFNKDLVDQLGCELRTRDEQIRDLQEKVDQQVRVIQALEEGNMRVSSESTLRKARVRGLEMDKQELQGEINSAHEAVARQASKIQELLAAKEYVDEEREFDRSVNEDLNYKLVELGDKFEHQKEDLAELEHCLQQKDDEIQELEARLSAAQNDTNERTQQLECEMARLNEVSEGRAVILRELQTQHCHLKEAKTNADEKLQALDKENSALAKFVVIIKNESEGQVNKITQLEQRFAHLQQKLSEEQSKQDHNSTFQAKVSELGAAKSEMENCNFHPVAYNYALDEHGGDLRARIAEVEAQNAELKTQLAENEKVGEDFVVVSSTASKQTSSDDDVFPISPKGALSTALSTPC